MQNKIKSLFISILFAFNRLLASFSKGLNNIGGFFGIDARKEEEQNLEELMKLSAEETYHHWMGVLGRHDTEYRLIIEGKSQQFDGSVVETDYDEEEKEVAKQLRQLLKREMWALRAAYRDGRIFEFVKEKQKAAEFKWDFYYEDGKTWKEHKETGEKVYIDEKD